MSVLAKLEPLRQETVLLGPWPFAVPPGVALGLGGLVVLLSTRHVDPTFLAEMATALLEAFLPLAAGVLSATLAAHDDALELQLSLPTPYRYTAARRFGLLVGWTLVIEAATTLALHAALPWALPLSAGRDVLLWAAPTLWLVAAGALLALVARSRATAGALLGGIWVAQQAFHGIFATALWARPWFLFATLYTPGAAFWWTNRWELIGLAIGFGFGVWLFLRNSEWRLRAEDA